jgi:hypothetical protein
VRAFDLDRRLAQRTPTSTRTRKHRGCGQVIRKPHRGACFLP